MQQFEIAFSGEILPGAQLEQVKVAIAHLFKADEALLARLFSGQRMVIKQRLDAEATAKYQTAFTRAGALLEVRDLTEAAPLPDAMVVPAPVAAHAQQQPAAQPVARQAPQTAAVNSLEVAPRDEYMAAFAHVQAPDFGIAPVGEDLQPTPTEVPAPDLDLSGMALAPVGSDMGQLPGAEPITPPDTSHLKVLDE